MVLLRALLSNRSSPALPGMQSNFKNSGSILPLLLSCCRSPFLSELRAVDFHRLRSGSFEWPATVGPPALPGGYLLPLGAHSAVNMCRKCSHKMMHRTPLFTAMLLLLLTFWTNSYGQSTVGSIIGTTTNSTGEVIPGVTVTVVNESTHATQTLITGSHGEYAASALNPGTYTVTGSVPGFRILQESGIVVRSEETVRTDLPLKKYDVAMQVEVTAGAPVLENEMPSISTTVTGLELTQTSSNLLGTKDATGNSGLEEYIALLPTGHEGNGAHWSMAGSTVGQEYYNVDGISSNSTLYANAVGPAFPSYDIVEEVKYDAVNNKAVMGQLLNITVVTKSGTDQFHGSVFEHFGNQGIQAQSYFSKSTQPYTDNDFGGGVGGPILKRKAFFFGAYEGLRNNLPIAITPSVPTLAFRSGNFSSLLSNAVPIIIINPYTGQPFPGNTIAPDLLTSSQSQAALKWQTMFYPSPNFGSADQSVGNFRDTYPQSAYSNRFDLRLDMNRLPSDTAFILLPTNAAFVRFSYNRASPEVLDSGLPPSITGYRIQVRKTYSGVFSDTWMITPNLFNIVKVGAMLSNNNFHPLLEGQSILDSLGIDGFPTVPANVTGFPTVSIDSFTSPGQLGPADGTEQNSQITDQVTYQHEKHMLSAGTEYRPQVATQRNFASFGMFTFDGSQSGYSYADFLLGLPQSTNYTYPGPTEYARQYFVSAFLQDDWRVAPNLLISYGMRYDFNSAPVDKYNTVSSFDPATGGIVVPSLTNVQRYIVSGFPTQIPIISAAQAGFPTRSLRSAFKGGFYPRLGFAYNVSSKTVIRGGYGIYSDDLTIDLFNDLYQAPYGGTVTYTNSWTGGTPAITFTNPTNASTGKLGAIDITGIDRDVRNPSVQQWNLTVERDIGFGTGLRFSYIGSRVADLLYGRNLNQVRASATIPWSQSNTAYPLYETVTQVSNGGEQSYNAFTGELSHHMRSTLSFEAAVTWAKNLTDDPNTNGSEHGVIAEDSYDLGRQRGNEQYSPRVQFVSNLIYSLPVGPGKILLTQNSVWSRIFGGWQLSAAYLANTGNYLTPMFNGVDPTNINAFAGSVSRTAISSAPVGKQSANNWFNPAAYAVPQAGQFGNAGYGILKGPDSQVLNAALFKSFPLLTEDKKLEVSGSFSNVLNHPNLGNPDVTITDTSVGKITGVQGYFFGPRSGLVSIRYTF
jgi:hypothetical protein